MIQTVQPIQQQQDFQNQTHQQQISQQFLDFNKLANLIKERNDYLRSALKISEQIKQVYTHPIHPQYPQGLVCDIKGQNYQLHKQIINLSSQCFELQTLMMKLINEPDTENSNQQSKLQNGQISGKMSNGQNSKESNKSENEKSQENIDKIKSNLISNLEKQQSKNNEMEIKSQQNHISQQQFGMNGMSFYPMHPHMPMMPPPQFLQQQQQEQQINSIDQEIQQGQHMNNKKQSYTDKLKQTIVELVKYQKMSIKQISQKHNIATKNIKRWLEKDAEVNDYYRNKDLLSQNSQFSGKQGRKAQDPQMEEKLYNFIIEETKKTGIKLNEKTICEKAKEFSSFKENFMASKNWYKRFCERTQIQQIMSELIGEKPAVPQQMNPMMTIPPFFPHNQILTKEQLEIKEEYNEQLQGNVLYNQNLMYMNHNNNGLQNNSKKKENKPPIQENIQSEEVEEQNSMENNIENNKNNNNQNKQDSNSDVNIQQQKQIENDRKSDEDIQEIKNNNDQKQDQQQQQTNEPIDNFISNDKPNNYAQPFEQGDMLIIPYIKNDQQAQNDKNNENIIEEE